MNLNFDDARRVVADQHLSARILPEWVRGQPLDEQAKYLTTLSIIVLPPDLVGRFHAALADDETIKEPEAP